ncbi:hypothetical protein ES703_03468 [subsurface metagenome]
MGRRQIEVSDELAYRWCERHRRGDSYSKIAADEGFERRLVGRVVTNFNRQAYLDEGTALRREIRAELLREHLEKLEKTAWELLRLTAGLSLEERCMRPQNIDGLLASLGIESVLINSLKVLLAETKKPVSSTDSIESRLRHHMFQREATAIVRDLKTHLPDIWIQMRVWENTAAEYQDNWRKLEKHAKNNGIPVSSLESSIQEGLRYLSMSQNEESFPPYRPNPQTPQEIGLWLFRNLEARGLLESLRNSFHGLKAKFDQLEGMLIPSELRHALLKRECAHCPMPKN